MKRYNKIMVILVTITLIGCSPKSRQEEHQHNEKLQLTAYNDDFEAFVEATPFVKGETSEMLVHLSFLENFKPLEKGSVTASLIIGTDGIRQTVEQPVRSGIYEFSLQPLKTGTGKLLFEVKTTEGISQIVIPDVTVYADAHQAQQAIEENTGSVSNGVVFTKEQSWKIEFSTDKARCEPFGQIIRATGQIQPSQGDEHIITAKTSGIVLFVGNNIVEGKAVNAKQILFSIDGSSMADNNLSVRYAEAENEYNRTKIEYERKRELAKEHIISQSDLLKAQTEFTNAETVYNNLHGNFAKGKQVVSSPFNGFVTRVLVRNGEYAQAGQPVLIVSQNRNLLIRAELQPKYFEILHSITSANIRVLGNNQTYTLEELGGSVVSFGKSTDIANPLVPVVFQVNNKGGLLSGSFVEVYIKTQTSTQAITVPSEAVVEEMGNYFVYVQLTPEFFEKRAIKKGVTDGIRTEIKEGLKAGERVVGKGAILVKLAQASGSLDPHAGHAH